MTKRSISVELDDETAGYLAVLGEPAEVLVRMAESLAEGLRRPGHPRREQTDESLRIEREKSDDEFAEERQAHEVEADEVVRVARRRADEVVRTARADAELALHPLAVAIAARSERARRVLEGERSSADATLEKERAGERRERHDAPPDPGGDARRETDDERADEVVRVARRRADAVVRAARDDADALVSPSSTANAASSERARGVVERERSSADALIEVERAARRRGRAEFVSSERETTDLDLTGERAQVDTVLVDQREANEQLVRASIEAQEVAERAEEAEQALRGVAELREMFIGILGHDLRNPLASIYLSANSMLRGGKLDAEDGAIVHRIIRSTQRITRMVSQLLDLTRARLGGGFSIEPKETDMRKVLRDVAEEFEAPVELEIEGDVTGTWDEDRLAEALSNLTGNAVDHAAPGTAVILKAHAAEAEVVVEIVNRGEPIPADVLPSMFEPFGQSSARKSARKGNLGLGLFIARQIALSHGGTLEACSAEGATTFVLRLPRHAPGSSAG